MNPSVTQRIGVISGSGPEAGIDLWKKILEENRSFLGESFRGDIDAPNVTILSVPELGYSMDLPSTSEQVWADLETACERLAPQVDVFAVACNTLYTFDSPIRSLGLDAELLSPVDSLITEVERRGLDSIGLLAAGPVMDLEGGASPYQRLAEHFRVELPHDRTALHELIGEVKLVGGSTPTIDRQFAQIASGLSVGTAALACTELPLIDSSGVDVDFIDPTRLLARDLLGIAPHP